MTAILLVMMLAFAAPGSIAGSPQSQAVASPAVRHAVGTFVVRITPLATDEAAPEGAYVRMRLSKTFHGGLEGTAAGEMLATLDDGQSGVYLALERVTGVLDGRTGSFTLAHRGVMDRGATELLITIVPGSGTGELAGIAGVFHLTMQADGAHRYDLEYTLPEGAR